MAIFELIKKTEVGGDVWYSIHKNGNYVESSITRSREEAEEKLEKFANGEPTKPIIETLKTIETDENN